MLGGFLVVRVFASEDFPVLSQIANRTALWLLYGGLTGNLCHLPSVRLVLAVPPIFCHLILLGAVGRLSRFIVSIYLFSNVGLGPKK